MAIPHFESTDPELKAEGDRIIAEDPSCTHVFVNDRTKMVTRYENIGLGFGGMLRQHMPECSKVAKEKFPWRCQPGIGGGTQRRCPNTDRVKFNIYLYFLNLNYHYY